MGSLRGRSYLSLFMLQGTRKPYPVLLLVLFGRFGFYKYMKMDEEEDDRPFFFPNPDGIY